MSTCRSCGAEILWCYTPTGRRMPLDAAPATLDTPGVWLLEPDGRAYALSEKNDRTILGGNLHVPHFATCPDADQFRKRGAA